MTTQSKPHPAEVLNTKFDNLGLKFDNYYTQIPIKSKELIQKTISDWQDWYYSIEEYGNWSVQKLSKWIEAYDLVSKLLDSNINEKNLKPVTPKVYEPTKKIEIKKPTLVYGRTPKKTVGLILTAGTLLGGFLYSVTHSR